jgi:hypothetical protein
LIVGEEPKKSTVVQAQPPHNQNPSPVQPMGDVSHLPEPEQDDMEMSNF